MLLSENWVKSNRTREVLSPLYWNIFLRTLGVAMVGLFTPLFIFKLGRDYLSIAEGLRWVALYLVFQRILMVLGGVGVAKVVERIGYGLCILIGNSLLVIYFLMPLLGLQNLSLVMAMAAVSAPALLFYWIPRLSILSNEGSEGKFGREVGIIQLLERGAGILAPFVGGVVVQTFGFDALFLLGGVIILASCVPLLFVRYRVVRDGVSWRGLWQWWIESRNLGLKMGHLGTAVDAVVTVHYWPIFIFLIFNNYERLGVMAAITAFISMIVAFLVGRAFDKGRSRENRIDKKIFYSGGIGLGVVYVLRMFVSSFLGVWAVDLISKLISPLYLVPFDGYLYSAGKKRPVVEFYVYREITYSLMIVLVGLLVFFSAGMSAQWGVMFSFSALGIFISMAIARSR